MLYKNIKPCAVISYDTATSLDLKFYLKEENVSLIRVDPTDFLQNPTDEYQYINLVIKDFDLRKKISLILDQQKLNRFSYIHPSSVTNGATVGSGVFIYPSCSTYTNTVIKNDVIINGNSFLAHYTNIGNGTVISAGVTVGGSTQIGDFSFCVIGSTFSDKLTICNDVFVGAGAVVIKNIDHSGTYVGIPAKNIKLK